MRPHPNELLDSARHSLRDVLIPAISDDWALYVAKCLDKVLADVQVRIERDLAHLARDTAELATLFEDLRAIADEGFADVLPPSPIDTVLDPELADGLYAKATAANETARTHLAATVDRLYAIERGEHAGSPDAAATAHARVREHLQRQLARDVELMSPVFMAFGDPQRVSR